jgi:hypothetical protein
MQLAAWQLQLHVQIWYENREDNLLGLANEMALEL